MLERNNVGGVGFPPSQLKGNEMKNLNKILMIAAFAAVSGLAGRASAQYQAVGDDGIAAAPKLRQQLNERKKVTGEPSMTVASVSYQATRADGIAASPKLRRQLEERKTVGIAPAAVVASAGYEPTGADGITASPKLRERLNERASESIMMAPLK
jgi:hypothetical protein